MSHTIVIFGATGDLTRRKLIPALFSLFRKGQLPDGVNIVGVSRSPLNSDEFRDRMSASTREFASTFDESQWDQFSKRVHYCPGDIGKPEDFVELRKFLYEVEGGSRSTRVYYLSTSPKLYETAIKNLGEAHGADVAPEGPDPLKGNTDRRVVIEKPFGIDLPTARALNQVTHSVFDERQVYRIDHYLGKETVQNLLILRFGNAIFEPIWNRNYVDHVEITVAEEVTIGSRAGYYDSAGVLRDMFQNHLLQLLMVTAMESPVEFEADMVRDEKVKVLRAIRDWTPETLASDTFRGQYDGYLQEPGVADGSRTATFAALKLFVDNWRWQGVPFYLRSGKGMSCRTTQIVVQFHEPPHRLFEESGAVAFEANKLLIQIQPAEGIQLHFQSKVPEGGMKMRSSALDFRFSQAGHSVLNDAYQRLLLDALNGDASLFARSDEVELAWSVIDPITNSWSHADEPPVNSYPIGYWGPENCSEWIQGQGNQWFDVCPVLH